MSVFKEIKNSNIAIVGVERIFSQVSVALYFFYIASYISKSDLGIYNWILSLVTVGATIASFGIESVIARRIAVDNGQFNKIGNIVFSYLLAVSLITTFVCFTIYLINSNETTYLFLLCIIQACLSFFMLVLRQINLGLENFAINSKANILNSILKVVVGGTVIYFIQKVEVLFWILIISNLITSIYYIYIVKKKFHYSLKIEFDKTQFSSLFRESLPLLGVVLFNAALARFDWIFLGMFQDMSSTGDYTFTYRVYEICWLPQAIVSAVVFPKISKICSSPNLFDVYSAEILRVLKFVLSISAFVPFIACFYWSPVVDFATAGKYGESNQFLFEILCMAIPFTASIGMMWNILMGLRESKYILYITIVTCALNIPLNIFLIIYYGVMGAGIANLISNLVQFIMYYYALRKHSNIFTSYLICTIPVFLCSIVGYKIIGFVDSYVIKTFILLPIAFISCIVFYKKMNAITLFKKIELATT